MGCLRVDEGLIRLLARWYRLLLVVRLDVHVVASIYVIRVVRFRYVRYRLATDVYSKKSPVKPGREGRIPRKYSIL